MFTETLLRNAIGYADPLEKFASLVQNSNGYPPHNIEKLDEHRFRLTLAVAGFSKNDIEMELKDGLLTIRSTIKSDDDEKQYLYRGIASRNFTRYFKLGENVEVTTASMEDGLLTVDLERIVPEALKPKLIEIR